MKNKKIGIKRSALAVLLAAALALSATGCGGGAPERSDDEYTRISADTLIRSRYAVDMSKIDYVSGEPGLRNPYIVGADGEKFENEVKYPVPASAHKIEVAAPAYEFQDSTAAVQRALNEAAAYQKEHTDAPVSVKFPAGRFYLYQGAYDPSLDDTVNANDPVYDDGVNGRYCVYLNGRKNISFEGTVDANGKCATEILLMGANGVHFMKINRCENVRLVNLQIDYGDLPYYFGEVTEVSRYRLRVKTWADYPVEDTGINVYIEFDKDSNCIRDNGNHLYNASGLIDIKSVKYVNGDKHLVDIEFGKIVSSTPVGTKVAMSTMKTAGNLVIVENSKNIYFETVYMYCGGGSIILGYANENLYFNRFMAVLKPGTDRLLSMAGDVIHVEDTKGDFVLSNSQIENTQDDGVNVCSHYVYPYQVNKSNRTAVLMYRGAMDETYECNEGDILAMMDTFTMLTVGYYGVESVTVNQSGQYVVKFAAGGKATLPSGEEVTLEEDISAVGTSDNCIFSNLTRSPVVLVENTVIRNKRNRGLLLQSRNITIRNCEFNNVVHTAVQCIGEMRSFCESTLPRDVIIENCKFVNCDTGDIEIAAYNNQTKIGAAGAIANVKIVNNLFAYQQNKYSLYLGGISDLDISDNWFYRPQTGTAKVNFDTTAICFRNVSGVKFDGNRLDKFLPSRDGIFVWEGVDLDSFDWGDNAGFERKDVFGESKTQQIARLDSAVEIDAVTADWAGLAATDIAIDNVTNVHIQKLDISAVPEGDFAATVKAFVKFSDSGDFAADDGLYFYFDVTDDIVSFERASWWAGDCFEFYLSSDTKSYDEIGAIRDDEGVETLQLAIKGDGEGNCSPCIYPGRTTSSICEKLTLDASFANSEYKAGDIKTAFKITRTGYRGEVFIPFELFRICGEKLRGGDEIAMAFCFVDSTETGGDETWSKSMTFSNVPHPTSTNNKIPASMVRFKV